MTKLWLEAWTRPGDASFGQLDPDVPVRRCSFTQRLNGVGEADAIIPDTYDLSTLFDSDPDTPANSKSCLFRIFAEGHTGPVADWIPSYKALEQDARDPDQEVPGQGIETILSYARTEPYDWDGNDDQQSRFPDWIWGGRNILGDVSTRYIPESVSLEIVNATGGTFTITVINDAGTDTTGNIAYNEGALGIDVALTALSNVTFVEVTGTNPSFTLQFGDESQSYIVSANSAGLTGTGADVLVGTEQQSGLRPAGWEISRSYLSDLPHGEVIEFRMWETGDPAAPAGCDTDQIFMFNGTEPSFPGVQKVQNVKPGGLYQASAQITAASTGEVVRFVIRDLAENLIGQDEQTIATGGTFQTFSIADVQIPDNVDQVIVRVGHVGTGDPGRIFVACPELNEGMSPASPGEIIDALYQDAVANHLADGRLVWDDGGGATPYLTLDFTDALDSDGAAWTDTDISLTIKRGMSYLGVMGELAKLGYEFRVVPNNWETGTYLWQVYNNGTLGTDYTAADSPSIEGGRDDVRRDVRVFSPPFTDVAVEGANQNFGRARNANLLAALGRIEGYKPEQDLGTLTEVAQAADAYAANANAETLSLTYTLSPGAGHDIPLVDYEVGDLLRVQDPPISMNRRIALVQVVFGSEYTEYVVQAGTASYVGALAVGEAVRILTAEFKAIRQTPPENQSEIYAALSSGGKIPWLVASVDAPDNIKATAGFICDGLDDQDQVNEALNLYDEALIYGELSLTVTDGGDCIDIPFGKRIVGFGRAFSVLQDNSSSGPSSLSNLVRMRGQSAIVGLTVSAVWEKVTAVRFDDFDNDLLIEDCHVENFEQADTIVAVDNDRVRIVGSTLECQSTADVVISSTGQSGQWNITDCQLTGGARNIDVGDGTTTTGAFDWKIVDNVFRSAAFDCIRVNGGRAGYFYRIAGNRFRDWGGSAVDADRAAAFKLIGSGEKVVTDLGSNPWRQPGVFEGNTLESGYFGVVVEDHAALNVRGNFIQALTCGVLLDNTDDCVIQGNQVYFCGSGSTFPAMLLLDDSNDNFISGNQFRTDQRLAATQPDHGIEVRTADCDCNMIVGNDLRERGFPWAVSPIDDQGTNTELFWPSDVTNGDNFVLCGGS